MVQALGEPSLSALCRRGALGLLLGPRRPNEPGAPVSALRPDGPAARAGVQPKDLVTGLDGRPIASPEELSALRLPRDTAVRLTLSRAGRTVRLSINVAARPMERYEGAQVTYGEASSSGLRLRTILCVPEGVTRPACVFYIPGYQCVSVEDTGAGPIASLVRGLLAQGLAVFRVDKRGTGDSDGPVASDATLLDEHQDLAAALSALMAEPTIDASRVTLFGHSLGGLHAPALAREHPTVRSVAIYGGGVLTWREYLIALTRRRLTLRGTDPAVQDDLVREAQRFHALLFAQGLPLASILRAHPEFDGEHGVESETMIHGRRDSFWQAVDATNIPLSLSGMTADLMALWGGADWLTFREEHELMVEMVNRWRPGSARFVELLGADHAMCVCESMLASFEGRAMSELHPGVLDALRSFVQEPRRG